MNEFDEFHYVSRTDSSSGRFGWVPAVIGIAYLGLVGLAIYDIATGGKMSNPPRIPVQVLQNVSGVPAPSKLEDLSLRK